MFSTFGVPRTLGVQRQREYLPNNCRMFVAGVGRSPATLQHLRTSPRRRIRRRPPAVQKCVMDPIKLQAAVLRTLSCKLASPARRVATPAGALRHRCPLAPARRLLANNFASSTTHIAVPDRDSVLRSVAGVRPRQPFRASERRKGKGAGARCPRRGTTPRSCSPCSATSRR